jgi:hypothetical protein
MQDHVSFPVAGVKNNDNDVQTLEMLCESGFGGTVALASIIFWLLAAGLMEGGYAQC